jgi:hypothetical protein
MNKATLSIGDLSALLEATLPTSALGRWFAVHQQEFERLLKTVRPRWEALAVKFAEEGLITVPPEFWHEAGTAERQQARRRAAQAARQVWQRVKRKPARATSAARLRPAATRPAQAAPMALTLDEVDDEFRPVRPARR